MPNEACQLPWSLELGSKNDRVHECVTEEKKEEGGGAEERKGGGGEEGEEEKEVDEEAPSLLTDSTFASFLSLLDRSLKRRYFTSFISCHKFVRFKETYATLIIAHTLQCSDIIHAILTKRKKNQDRPMNISKMPNLLCALVLLTMPSRQDVIFDRSGL